MPLSTKLRGLQEVWQFDNRWWLIFTKTLFRHERLHVYRYQNLEILLDHQAGDANGAREILTTPMYRRYLPLMQLSSSVNVLDLGANTGGFSLLLHSEKVDLKKVAAVEFNPHTFARLQFNLRRNLTCEVAVLNAALCGAQREFLVPNRAGGTSDNIYLASSDEPAEQKTLIRGLTFDQICREQFGDETIDVCKMDVEGAEFEVFAESAEHQRLAQCRYLIIEIHEYNQRRAAEVIPIIENFGFVEQPFDKSIEPWTHFFINSRLA